MGKSFRKNKKTGKRMGGRKTQKIWRMKGCAHNKRTKCVKRLIRRRRIGGGCGCDKIIGGGREYSSSSSQRKESLRGGCGCGVGNQAGGSTNSALIGSPWTANISSWPGVQGVPGVTNHYNLNEYKSFDPQTQMGSERGQYGGTRTKKNKRGGGLIPQDLVNMGRNMMFGVGSAYNSLSGYQAPVNPLPYKNQLVNPNPSRTLGY